MASLPWDIIVDILCRLPEKDLLRYRSVSKRWVSQIDGPDFFKMHLNNSIETSNLKLYWVDLVSLDLAVKLNHHSLRGDSDESEVVGSCHGLMDLSNSDCDAAIWNPSTRWYRKLPFSDVECSPVDVIFLPSIRCIVFGFGFYPISNDYKLVRIVLFFGDEGEDSFESDVKIYSAESNTWKRISDLPYYLRFSCVHGDYANNALHWVVSRNPMSDPSNFVLALDLVTEEYREVLLPDCKDAVDFMNVEVLGGSLRLLCNYAVENLLSFDLEKEMARNVRISSTLRYAKTALCVGSFVGLDGIDGQHGWKLVKEDGKYLLTFQY